jgi:transcriptional regulator with XRE-family HTH domain
MKSPPSHLSIKIMMDSKYLGACLRTARKRKGILRKQLARHLGMTNREMLCVECGRVIIQKHELIKLFQQGMNIEPNRK